MRHSITYLRVGMSIANFMPLDTGRASVFHRAVFAMKTEGPAVCVVRTAPRRQQTRMRGHMPVAPTFRLFAQIGGKTIKI